MGSVIGTRKLGGGIWLTSLLLIYVVSCVTSERILFLLPLSTKSHMVFTQPLVKALADKGHQVTVLTNEKWNPGHKFVTELMVIEREEVTRLYPDAFEKRKSISPMSFPFEFALYGCHMVANNDTFQKTMKNMRDKFDLIVMDGFLHDCFAGYLYKSQLPFVIMTSMPAPSYISECVGNFLPPSTIPVMSNLEYDDSNGRMTYLQRLINMVHFLRARFYVHVIMLPRLESVYLQHLKEDLPGILEIEGNASMIFMNSHFSMTLPRPLLPNIVEIGGIHCVPAKPLNVDLETFLSKSAAPDGFILMSMGSLIHLSRAPQEFIEVLFSTFSKLKQNVVIKAPLSLSSYFPIPKNVMVSDWLPQQDLLGHDNIRLFISHGGLLSMQEAVYHSVPVLAIPLGLDQDTNVRKAVLQGFAEKIEFENINYNTFYNSIQNILNNSRYYENVERISKLFKSHPISPLDNSVFWIEFVLTKQALHNSGFHSPARQLNIFQYYSCDTIIFLLILIVQVFRGCKAICQFILKKSRNKLHVNKKDL